MNASFGRALYNLGILYQDKGEFSEAAESFRESKIEDWKSRVCYCYYKGNNLTKFLSEFETTMNYRIGLRYLPVYQRIIQKVTIADPYNFCSDPLKYVRNKLLPS